MGYPIENAYISWCIYYRTIHKSSAFRNVVSEAEQPYIPAEEEPAGLTPRVFVIGIILGALMTAANAYLGLKVGMTVSASIPAAVMSMLILRGLKFKDVSIIETTLCKQWPAPGKVWLPE